MPGTTKLRVAESVLDDLRAHGEQAYPLECCGALLGRPVADGWEVVGLLRAANADTAPRSRYRIAPEDLVRMDRAARSHGLEIAGFYHSHPDRAAQWSPTDLTEAHWIDCCYLIAAVGAGQAVATRAFLLAGSDEADKHFEPMEMEVSGESRQTLSTSPGAEAS